MFDKFIQKSQTSQSGMGTLHEHRIDWIFKVAMISQRASVFILQGWSIICFPKERQAFNYSSDYVCSSHITAAWYLIFHPRGSQAQHWLREADSPPGCLFALRNRSPHLGFTHLPSAPRLKGKGQEWNNNCLFLFPLTSNRRFTFKNPIKGLICLLKNG